VKDQETIGSRAPSWLMISFLAIGVFSLIFLANQLSIIDPPPKSEDDSLVLYFKGGVRVNDHAKFIEQVRKDLNTPKEIKLFLSPVVYGIAELMETSTSYIILVDIEFYNSLSAIEQKALLGHELGHILDLEMSVLWNKNYRRPSRKTAIEEQMRADSFGAKYTSPDTMIILLDKMFDEYHLRVLCFCVTLKSPVTIL